MRVRALYLSTFFASMVLAACDGSSPSEPRDKANPEWITGLIQEIASQPVTNPPTTLWSYRFRGETVYYRSARCCDVWSELYTAQGALLCHPDGGITGRGDGRCPDFSSTRSNETLIYRDPR